MSLLFIGIQNIIPSLQNDSGRFTGRWSYGHYLWNDYKQIAQELTDRTKAIQKQRGIPDPTKQTINYSRQVNRVNYDANILKGDEPDTLDVRYIEKGLGGKVSMSSPNFNSKEMMLTILWG